MFISKIKKKGTLSLVFMKEQQAGYELHGIKAVFKFCEEIIYSSYKYFSQQPLLKVGVVEERECLVAKYSCYKKLHAAKI